MSASIYRVDYLDGSSVEVVVSFTPAVVLRAERQFKQPIGPMLVEGYLEPVFFGAWFTLHRNGQTPLQYEAWVDVVAGLEAVEPAASEDEVEAENPPESSSSTESPEPPQP